MAAGEGRARCGYAVDWCVLDAVLEQRGLEVFLVNVPAHPERAGTQERRLFRVCWSHGSS